MAQYTPKSQLQQSRELKSSSPSEVASRPSIEVNVDLLDDAQRAEADRLAAEQEALSAFAPLSTPVPSPLPDGGPDKTLLISASFEQLRAESSSPRPSLLGRILFGFAGLFCLLIGLLSATEGGFLRLLREPAVVFQEQLGLKLRQSQSSPLDQFSFESARLRAHRQGALIQAELLNHGERYEGELMMRWRLEEPSGFIVEQGLEPCCVTLSDEALEEAIQAMLTRGEPLPRSAQTFATGQPAKLLFFAPHVSAARLKTLKLTLQLAQAPSVSIETTGVVLLHSPSEEAVSPSESSAVPSTE